MIKKLRKVGNSNALILDKPILELLGLAEGDEVQLSIHEGALIVLPTDPQPFDRKRFEASLDRVIEERRKVLRKLAE